MNATLLKILPCWVILIALFGCSTLRHERHLQGKYVNRETGGVVIFESDGRFYYSFLHLSGSEGLPANSGSYSFSEADPDSVLVSVRSAHAGLFHFRFSKSKQVLYVNHPGLSAKEIEYELSP